jgi:adenylate cyclase
MAKEIERKFLVAGEFQNSAENVERITQGYLCSLPERTVRVRIRGDQGFLTIKGRSDECGIVRDEFEYEIPLADARALISLCEYGVIDKLRYRVPYHGHVWEVDVFHGMNEGLIVAEIELSEKDECFERPSWLGEEVTGYNRYYNASLSKYPYARWNHEEK